MLIKHMVFGEVFVCIFSFYKHFLINLTYNSNHTCKQSSRRIILEKKPTTNKQTNKLIHLILLYAYYFV